MAKSMKTRRRSTSVDSDRGEAVDVEMEMVDDEGAEEEEGKRKKQKEKGKQLERGKPGQKKQKRGRNEDREEEVDGEEMEERQKRLKKAEVVVEEEEEEEEMGQDETDDEVDDHDMDEGSVQTDRDDDVPMEGDHDSEDGQEKIDDEMVDFDVDDGSVQTDRKGNVTMYDVDNDYQTLDGSLQEDLELEEGGENVEEDNGEDTDLIPESERGEEVGDGGQSGVEEGGDAEWDGLESPGSAINDDEEEEEEEEEYEPEEIEREWADGEVGGEEEGENEDEGEDMEDEEGTTGDSSDANAGANPPAPAEEHAEQEVTLIDEEGNNDSTTETLPSADGEENAGIYNTVKELIQNIPPKHFVYCRTLDQPSDIQDVAFKVYDIDGKEYKFDTQNLQKDPEALGTLLSVAQRIYKKDNGYEFVNLERDPTFIITARNEEKAEPKSKKKPKAKSKAQSSTNQEAPTYKGHLTVVDGGVDGGQWGEYIQRLAEEALDVLGLTKEPELTFKPQLEYMFVWGEKTLFRDHDFPAEDNYHVGRLLVILAGPDYEGGEFAFGSKDRCHYFDPQAQPCLIATLSDGTAYVDPHPLTSSYRLGLVYQLRVPTAKMAKMAKQKNKAKHAVEILNEYEKEFLDGLATWRNRAQNADEGERNGIHRTVYYILKKQLSGTKEFDPSADLTPAQKLQLAWLYKLCSQMPGKRIGDQVYEWLLHVDLAVLSCRTVNRVEKDGAISPRPGFEVEWTADADIETDDWNRNEGEAGMEVKEEALINFGDPGFGSSGLDEYLCLRLNIA
ncbi:hypothetical protein N0V85_008599 [Neurospora sp. IMI 360204]|nr:hypothetical protein N0V85_008599 [Neurospora sp. IMI 360204]